LLLPRPAAAVLTAEEARRKAGELKSSGVRAYQEGHLSRAVEDLRAAIEINLNDFFAHFYLGLALRDLRRYSEAREVLEVAAELDPRYLQVYVALGDVALGQGDPGEARVWYQKALQRQESYAPALDGLGRLAEAKGEEEEAIRKYREAIESNRGFPMPYVHLGDIYRRQGRIDDAVNLFHEAIKYQPNFAEAFRFLGVAYGELGRRTEAIALLERAAELEPENAGHPVALGRLLASWDNRIQARAAFTTARELAPDSHEPYLGLAELERREGRFEEALTWLDAALAVSGLDDETRTTLLARHTQYRSEQRRLAEIRERLADAERARAGAPGAVASPGAAAEDDPAGEAGQTPPGEEALAGWQATPEALAWARLELARMLRDVDDFPGAFEACRSTLDDLGRPLDLVFECGYYALAADDFDPARDLLDEVTRRDPSDERALIDLGLAYAGLGRLTSAADAYRRALELNSSSIEAALYLGNANLRLGLIDDAEAAYRTVLRLAAEPVLIDRIQKLLLALDDIRNPSLNGPDPDTSLDIGREVEGPRERAWP
jgi:tetratricopeptide (TPR) repeat protein